VTERDQNAAVEDGATLAHQPVGYPSARQGERIDAERVQSIDGTRGGRVITEAADRRRGGHEENEQRPHPVVAEALPHLGEEEGR
jgi:hypothetical protein